ncbi:hypothetical protein BDP27DRAFT_1305250 [Rhodocollybia butyracea]|uniref:Uncharacterized protein n=1 Tax=Rhodocollybia butyracea TaxID=206335 RepID=A0A9P5TVL0_9AGAR|nr:hypothetical protein BDP27DRAFT_1305250 [Rhodocollybia butyracea]
MTYPPGTLEPISSSLSETDTFSDSDWLDIASNRESDTESLSSNNGGASSSLSRRSSISTGSSNADEIEAWEGFIEDSTDEAETQDDASQPIGVEEEDSNSPFIDLDKVRVEERRVRDGLEQSLTSTLSASRTSSHSSTVHSSLRDLRLSFPDPLNHSRDELNISYDRVSSSEVDFAADATVSEDDQLTTTVVTTGISPTQDPGESFTPEVLGQELPQSIQFDSNVLSANLQVVLFGKSTLNKWSFVEELLRKAIVGGGVSSVTPDKPLNPMVIDRTGDSAMMPCSDDNPDRPSLAIIFLPHTIAYPIGIHTAYLPVFVSESKETIEKDFQEASETWASYGIEERKVVRLEGGGNSLLFAAQNVDKLDPCRTNQAIQRIVKQEKPASWARLFEQFNTVHAVTIFALMCIIAGFSVNTVLNITSLKGFDDHSPSPTIPKSDNNQSTALAVRATTSLSIVPASIDFVPATYNSHPPADSSLGAGPSTSALPSSKPGNRNAGPITQLEETFLTWSERMRVSKDVMVRPSTTVAQASPSMDPIASTPTTVYGSSSAVAVRLVDSVSEIVLTSVKALVEVLQHDMNDLVLALDELMLAIQRSANAVTGQSKSVAQAVREQFEYRNAKAKGKARQLKEQFVMYAGSAVSEMKDLIVSSEAWSSYAKHHGSWKDTLTVKAKRARHRAREMRNRHRHPGVMK